MSIGGVGSHGARQEKAADPNRRQAALHWYARLRSPDHRLRGCHWAVPRVLHGAHVFHSGMRVLVRLVRHLSSGPEPRCRSSGGPPHHCCGRIGGDHRVGSDVPVRCRGCAHSNIGCNGR
eukprot:Amastigsp_a678119_16.p2 type:complete len:120 gc:universal Amastigsp_a678119_16:622-263(-)